MNLLATLLRVPNLMAQLLVSRNLKHFVRIHFLHASIECGLFEALQTPASRDQLIDRLGVKREQLFDSLLNLGCSLKELKLESGLYRVVGKRSSALSNVQGDPLAAAIQEYVTYHGSVYRHLAPRLRGSELGDYLSTSGTMIARSSRLVEPFVVGFLEGLMKQQGGLRLLEIGSGSGVYLRHAAEMNPLATGIGIDVQPEVADQASKNLQAWGVSGKFRIEVADIRRLPPELAVGTFDVITLFNNIYYFPEDERPALFRIVKTLLAPEGVLGIVSMMKGKTPLATDFDLILQSTIGCTALPDLDKLKTQLQDCDFTGVETVKLLPVEPFWGVSARVRG
jgi:SAM-dependent methyltransferase